MRHGPRSLIAIFFLLPSLSSAASPFGASASYVLSSREISSLNGLQFMINYHPELFVWCQWSLYFDGGFSHFWVTNTPHHSTLNIYSVAPVLRYTMPEYLPVCPYIEASIGLAYLNHTRLDNRNLGIHFAFQDRLGVGVRFGETKQLSVGFHIAHYSNAHFSGHNSGFTLPAVFDVGIRL